MGWTSFRNSITRGAVAGLTGGLSEVSRATGGTTRSGVTYLPGGLGKLQTKVGMQVQDRLAEVELIPSSFSAFKRNVAITAPSAKAGYDLAHRTSTALVNETSRGIENVFGKDTFIGGLGEHWKDMSQKDKVDDKRWATNTVATAGAIIGGPIGGAVSVARTADAYVDQKHAKEAYEERVANYNQQRADAAARSATQPTFADFVSQLLASFKGGNAPSTLAPSAGSDAGYVTFDQPGDMNTALLIGGAVLIVVALVISPNLE